MLFRSDCAVDDVYEFVIPWADIGLAPRYTTRIKVVSSWAASLSYGDGEDMEIAPPAPAELVLPDLEEWVTLLELDDVVGDENGDGDYTYPLASDFTTDNGGGLWDAKKVTVRQSAWNAQFIIEMDEMTDIWGLANGFSHQIVQIYVDQGDTTYGETEMLTGANAEVHPDWAWEVAISGTGEPGAVQSVQAETGSTSARGIDVTGNVQDKTIIFTVSKDVIGSDVANYRYIIVIGSQDGFGTGKWRDVDATAKTWRLGGGADPADDDGIDYDPNIVDIILDGDGQQAMLSSYDVNGHVYAQLTGFEMPAIAQQIYGFKHVSSTADSAILEWSTTQAASGDLSCNEAGQTTVAVTENWTSLELTNTVTVSGLSSGIEYECMVSIGAITSELVNFTTASIIDTEAPELLNLAVEVLDDGRARISWYSSESATEEVSLDGVVIFTDEFATKKNHQYITTILADGTYGLIITGSDASGNSNSSSINFVVDIGDQVVDNGDNNADTLPDNPAEEEDSASSDISSTTMQIAVLAIILLLVIAFIRVNRNDSSDDEKWS